MYGAQGAWNAQCSALRSTCCCDELSLDLGAVGPKVVEYRVYIPPLYTCSGEAAALGRKSGCLAMVNVSYRVLTCGIRTTLAGGGKLPPIRVTSIVWYAVLHADLLCDAFHTLVGSTLSAYYS